MDISVEVPEGTGRGAGRQLNIELLCDSVVSLLGICPKDSKSTYLRDTGISMFTAALFTITKIRNWSRLWKWID